MRHFLGSSIDHLPALPEEEQVVPMISHGSGEELIVETRQKQLEHELYSMLNADRHNAKLPPLPDLTNRKQIGRNWDKYRAYRPIIFKDIADVIEYKGFNAIYPQTFVPIARHYLENGISPPYVVHEDEDYCYGVASISTMIELVENNLQWCVADDKDVPVIIGLCRKYLLYLNPYVGEDSQDHDMKYYYGKVEKFIRFLEGRMEANAPAEVLPDIINVIRAMTR